MTETAANCFVLLLEPVVIHLTTAMSDEKDPTTHAISDEEHTPRYKT